MRPGQDEAPVITPRPGASQRSLVPAGQPIPIIVNPVAHNFRRPLLKQVDAWLWERGHKAEWLETRSRGHATQLAASVAARRFPLVLVWGGDGTLNEAANGLAGSETALAPIPAGTVNIWAREMRIPRRPLLAVKAVLAGERRRVDLGKAGERHFLLMAGYGLDGAIARRVSHAMKGRVGAAAYALAAVREALSYPASRLDLVLDREKTTVDSLMLVAGNTRNYAGVAQVTPRALVDDGFLDVCVYQGQGLIDILWHGMMTVLRRHLRSSRVLYRQVRRLEIGWERPLPVQVDGDDVEESPRGIAVAPKALCVIVPAGLRSPLFSRSAGG